MRERALIHVAGPRGAGKTTFIEVMLGAFAGLVLAARCVRDPALLQSRETAPKNHPELRRYREAGATGAAVFAFPESDIGSDAFFVTHLMDDYSQATVLESDNPLEFVDLAVFVTHVMPTGETLFVRRKRDRAGERRAKADAIEWLLGQPDGVAELLGQMAGGSIVELARKRPKVFEETRANLLSGIGLGRRAAGPKSTEHWVVADGYEGIQHAQLVVVNIRSEAERPRGEQLVGDIGRLRKDTALFDDILGFRGSKIPVTAVVANLADPADPGTKKAVTRARRALRTRS